MWLCHKEITMSVRELSRYHELALKIVMMSNGSGQSNLAPVCDYELRRSAHIATVPAMGRAFSFEIMDDHSLSSNDY